MALLGQTIVEAGLARGGALWPQSRRPAQLRLVVGKSSPASATALATANSIYAGQHVLSADDFASLNWLQHFAQSGRQLLMCHALKLMEGWNALHLPRSNVDDEADLVLRLVRSAKNFSAVLDASLLQPLQIAIANHLKRLQSLRSYKPCEQLTKAMTLLEAAKAIEESAGLEKDAAKLLDQALPSLIAVDGGPILHGLAEYVAWISLLLDADARALNVSSRNALDRARPFLSMLLAQNHTYCFAPERKAHSDVVSTTPMRLAPDAGVVRVQAGKMALVSLPQQLNGEAMLHVSSHGHWLFLAHQFQHDASEANAQTALSLDSSEEGHLIQQAIGEFERIVFLSAKGDDLRIEDVGPKDNLKRWMCLKVNPDAKMSVARNGSVATIAMDGRNAWSLSLRGARILPIQHNDQVVIESTGTNGPVNWALKRITRTVNRSEKPKSLVLPF